MTYKDFEYMPTYSRISSINNTFLRFELSVKNSPSAFLKILVIFDKSRCVSLSVLLQISSLSPLLNWEM